MLQCSLVLSSQPQTYSTDKSKVDYVMGLVTGRAKAWGAVVWNSVLSIRSSSKNKVIELKKVFNHRVRGRDASKCLLSLHQDCCSLSLSALYVLHSILLPQLKRKQKPVKRLALWYNLNTRKLKDMAFH